MSDDMGPLFRTIVDRCRRPRWMWRGPCSYRFRLWITAVTWVSPGRPYFQGLGEHNTPVAVIDRNGDSRNGKVLQVMGYDGLERLEVSEAQAGDIVCITGIDALNISDTLCSMDHPDPLPPCPWMNPRSV